jgi:hypothetical protein
VEVSPEHGAMASAKFGQAYSTIAHDGATRPDEYHSGTEGPNPSETKGPLL